MEIIFNVNILYQFISGIFSVVLTVTVIYIKREIDRKNKENYYSGLLDKDEVIGDVQIKLDEELPRENFLKLLTMWGIQPILLLVLLNFIEHNSYFKICWFFVLIVFTLFHEFQTGLQHSDKKLYQLLMLFTWLATFCILSYEKNISFPDSKIHAEKTQVHNM